MNALARVNLTVETFDGTLNLEVAQDETETTEDFIKRFTTLRAGVAGLDKTPWQQSNETNEQFVERLAQYIGFTNKK